MIFIPGAFFGGWQAYVRHAPFPRALCTFTLWAHRLRGFFWLSRATRRCGEALNCCRGHFFAFWGDFRPQTFNPHAFSVSVLSSGEKPPIPAQIKMTASFRAKSCLIQIKSRYSLRWQTATKKQSKARYCHNKLGQATATTYRCSYRRSAITK